MLVMLALGLSVCEVLLMLCLRWPLPSFSVSLIAAVRLGAWYLWVVVGFMHLVVLHGYQDADVDAEQHALTEQLFDAALGELGVDAREQPSPWSPPRFRLGSGLIRKLLGLLHVLSALGILPEAIAGILWLAALQLLLRFTLARWIWEGG